jgi:hypothetical protein
LSSDAALLAVLVGWTDQQTTTNQLQITMNTTFRRYTNEAASRRLNPISFNSASLYLISSWRAAVPRMWRFDTVATATFSRLISFMMALLFDV